MDHLGTWDGTPSAPHSAVSKPTHLRLPPSDPEAGRDVFMKALVAFNSHFFQCETCHEHFTQVRLCLVDIPTILQTCDWAQGVPVL